MKRGPEFHPKLQVAFACCALLLTIIPAFALWLVAKITPESTREGGIVVQTERRKDETLAFTVTRYLRKNEQADPNAREKVTRYASLEVRDKTSLLASTEVSAMPIDGALVYKFTLSPICAPYSKFDLYENGEQDEGGVIYQLDIPACVAFVQRHAPEHP